MQCRRGHTSGLGTLGFFAKDNQDGHVGLVTCRHVVEGREPQVFNPDVSEDEPIATVEPMPAIENVDAAFAIMGRGVYNPPQMKNEPRYFKGVATELYGDNILPVCYSTAQSPTLVTGSMVNHNASVQLYKRDSRALCTGRCEPSSVDGLTFTVGPVTTSNFTAVFDNVGCSVEGDFQCEVYMSDEAVRNYLTTVTGKVRGHVPVNEHINELAGRVEGTEIVYWRTPNELKLNVIIEGDYTITQRKDEYKSQIKIFTHQPVCQGDSGSLVRELKCGKGANSPEQYESRALGLLFCGEEYTAYAHPIQDVLNALNVHPYYGEEEMELASEEEMVEEMEQ